jgi:DNA (cytosine-5)-methyltransferase 1
MKILNLFAGIGGNRTLWGDAHEITAVEYDTRIAMIYQKRFPNDNVVVADAWEYVVQHFPEFDVIWASPSCTTHSKMMLSHGGRAYKGQTTRPPLPDLRLYSLIIYLRAHFRGEWAVENVIPYYKPLIEPTATVGRHLIWASRHVENLPATGTDTMCSNHAQLVDSGVFEELIVKKGIDAGTLELLKLLPARLYQKIVSNCVSPAEGKHILDGLITKKQKRLF